MWNGLKQLIQEYDDPRAFLFQSTSVTFPLVFCLFPFTYRHEGYTVSSCFRFITHPPNQVATHAANHLTEAPLGRQLKIIQVSFQEHCRIFDIILLRFIQNVKGKFREKASGLAASYK